MNKKANKFINGITKDEDRRQDLWVDYLTYGNLDGLNEQNRTLELEEKICINSIDLINEIGAKQLFTTYPELMSDFTQFEQTIIFLLLIGFSVGDISDYKNISPIRVQQTIYTIKQSKIWNSIREKIQKT